MEAKCENCTHAIYKNLWGEYKCGLKGRICEDSEVIMGCDSFLPIGSKSNKPTPEIIVRSGATFTPHVSDDGVLSWTNDKGLANPKVVNIKGAPGKEGKPGNNGYSPVVSVTDIVGGHRITVTDKDGGKTFDVMDGEVGQGGGGIIDVIGELPTENINDSAIYRLMTVECIYNREVWWVCRCVESLPEVGDPYYNGFYYSVADNDVYVYADDEVADDYGITVGWHKVSVVWELDGYPYGGTITDINDDPCDDIDRILISYHYYVHKNEWSKMIFAQDKAPEINIEWDGNMTGHETFRLDEDIPFVKVSDVIYTEEQLLGVMVHYSDGYSEKLDENNIYTELPGAMIAANDVIIISSIADFANSVGLPEGMGSNGVWFANYTGELGGGIYHVSRLVGSNKISKIQEKYLETPEEELYLTSPNGSRFRITVTDEGNLSSTKVE